MGGHPSHGWHQALVPVVWAAGFTVAAGFGALVAAPGAEAEISRTEAGNKVEKAWTALLAGGASYEAPADALAGDLARIAEARGWSDGEAAAYYQAEQVIGRMAERLAAQRPDVFVGSALSLEPGGVPRLFIKGPADETIRALVETADIPIDIVDDQPYSFDELEAKKTAVHVALLAAGYPEVVTTFDIARGGLVETTVRQRAGLPADARAVLSLLPEGQRANVVVSVTDAPVVVPASAFGGM